MIQHSLKLMEMTAIEIKAKEYELIQEIGCDENLLKAALKYIKNLKATKPQAPCRFTTEEKEAILLKGEEDAKSGLGILHDDFEKEFATW